MGSQCPPGPGGVSVKWEGEGEKEEEGSRVVDCRLRDGDEEVLVSGRLKSDLGHC